MKNPIRHNDIFRASAVVPVLRSIPSELVTANPTYAKMVAAMPDWLTPVSIGFALAVWLVDPWTNDSRLWKIWKWWTDTFEIDHLHVGHWSDWNTPGDIMPLTDEGLRLRIRFVRNFDKAKLRLRVYSCTGQGRKPFEHVIELGKIDAVKGKILDIPIVDIGLQAPGWDHERKRGWGPKKDADFIGGSRNVVIVECKGRFTQRERIFVAMVKHQANGTAPTIYFQVATDDVFDISAETRTGIWKYGGH